MFDAGSSPVRADAPLSVIVPVYNVLPYLGRCLESLARQTLPGVEVVVVDDGSTDGSGEFVDRFCRGKPSFVAIHQEHRCVGPARNAGLALAKGRYVAFVDGDDWVAEDYCRSLWEAARATGADLVSCDYAEVRDGRPPSGAVRAAEPPRVISGRRAVLAAPSMVWGKLYTRELVERSALRFSDHYYEDLAEVPRVLSYATKVALLSEVLYFYVRRPDSITNGGRYPNPKSADIFLGIDELMRTAADRPDFRLEFEHLARKKLRGYLNDLRASRDASTSDAIARGEALYRTIAPAASENPYDLADEAIEEFKRSPRWRLATRLSGLLGALGLLDAVKGAVERASAKRPRRRRGRYAADPLR